MNILITGAQGMLGRTLARHWGNRHQLTRTDRGDMDITRTADCQRVIGEAKPHVVIHCAAMTAVDKAETEQDLSYQLNALGTANVAAACHRHGAKLVTISTDYVFSGALDRPYHEWDETGPRTIYGATKLAGEDATRHHCPNHIIARIAWLYGAGGPSFVHTMLKLLGLEGAPLRVVDDQIGNPTSTDAVADGLERLIEAQVVGTVHLTCEGATTWYGFTRAIAAAKGLGRGIVPCATSEYPRPAPRPANSRLEKRVIRLSGLPPMPTWDQALNDFLTQYPNG